MIKKTDFNAKITEVEDKIPSITVLATNSALTDIENKIPDNNTLVKKTDFDAGLKKICGRVTSNKSKHLLVENELKKLETFDSSYFKGKSHFEEDGIQNYLVFQPMCRYFKKIAGVGKGSYIYFGKYKDLSDERINSITASDYSITPELSFNGTKTRVEFNGSCLKQDKVT